MSDQRRDTDVTVILDGAALAVYSSSESLEGMAVADLINAVGADGDAIGVPVVTFLYAFQQLRERPGDLAKLYELLTHNNSCLQVLSLDGDDYADIAVLTEMFMFHTAHCVLEAEKRNVSYALYAPDYLLYERLGDQDLVLPLEDLH